jgi:hypothetical protein
MRYLMSHDRHRSCWIIYDSEIDADEEDNTVAIVYTRQAAMEKRRLLNRIDREEVLSQPASSPRSPA